MYVSDLIQYLGLSAAPPDPDFEISGVRPLSEAERGDLSFLANPKYRAQVLTTRASVVLVRDPVEGCPAFQIACADPYASMAQVLTRLYPEPVFAETIHPTAVIAPDARIGKGCHIGPYCTVGAGSIIGDDAVLTSHVVVSDRCSLGDRVHLFAHVVLYPGTRVGDHVRIHAGTVIGGDGFGYVQENGRHRKIPQVAGVRIENEVEIGSNVSIDRGALSDTVIGEGSKIDNLVQIGHGVKIGKHSIIVSQTGISGSATVGNNTVLAGKVGVTGHVAIGDGILVMGDSVVTKNLDKPGRYAGNPAIPHMKYQRQLAQIRGLARLIKRVKALEEAMNEGKPNH